MVDVKKVGEKGNVVELLVKGTDTATMNAIRRTIMNAVPVFAVDEVSFYNNEGVVFDEMLAHRIGMIPLKTDSKRYKLGDKVRLVLDKEGPCTVYSKDLKCTDPKIEVVDEKVPLTKLKKGQKLKIEADAVMGTGKEHSKYQAAIVTYNELPVININKDCNVCKDCVEECARDALEVKANKVVLKNPLSCNLCGKCRDICKKKALTLKYDDSSFLMKIESHGGLENKELVSSAVDILKGKVDELSKEVRKLK